MLVLESKVGLRRLPRLGLECGNGFQVVAMERDRKA